MCVDPLAEHMHTHKGRVPSKAGARAASGTGQEGAQEVETCCGVGTAGWHKATELTGLCGLRGRAAPPLPSRPRPCPYSPPLPGPAHSPLGPAPPSQDGERWTSRSEDFWERKFSLWGPTRGRRQDRC